MFEMNVTQLTIILDSIIWAIRHTERNVAETGLVLLEDLITLYSQSNLINEFCSHYYMKILREIFNVMTGYVVQFIFIC